MVNSTVEAGEKLYSSTGSDGRENIRKQLLDLQQTLESLYDNLSLTEREMQANISRWSGFDECSATFEMWLKNIESLLKMEIELKQTLDEKRAQLQIYKAHLHDIQNHKQELIDLKDKVNSLPEKSEKITKVLSNFTNRYEAILGRVSTFVERY